MGPPKRPHVPDSRYDCSHANAEMIPHFKDDDFAFSRRIYEFSSHILRKLHQLSVVPHLLNLFIQHQLTWFTQPRTKG